MRKIDFKELKSDRWKTVQQGQRGQALIEVIVASAIMVFVGLAALSLMGTQFKETKGVSERLGALDLEKTLISTLADGSICKFEFAGKEFSASKSEPVEIDQIHASAVVSAPTLVKLGDKPSSMSPSLVVTKIALANIRNAGTPNAWIAEVQVSFDPKNLTRAIRPVTVQTSLQTDPAALGDSKKIVSCSGTGAGLCVPGPKIYIGTEDCDRGHLTTDQSFFPCASAYLGTLCKTE